MRCPACLGPLATFECEGVELDACPAGCGTWFDAGEIELLVPGVVAPQAAGGEEPGTRRCPRCRCPMQVRRIASAPELDLCPRGDGLWFDRGEVARLAASLAADPSSACSRIAPAFARLVQALEGIA